MSCSHASAAVVVISINLIPVLNPGIESWNAAILGGSVWGEGNEKEL